MSHMSQDLKVINQATHCLIKYILSSCLDTFAFIMTAKYTGKVIVFIGLKLGTESRAADFLTMILHVQMFC